MKSRESCLSTRNGTEISILTASCMRCPRRESGGQNRTQLEQFGMTKYLLNVIFPLEQLLWLSLFIPQMKREGTHTTSIGWPSLQPGKACFRRSTACTLKKRSRADAGYVFYFQKVLVFRKEWAVGYNIKFVVFPLYNFKFCHWKVWKLSRKITSACGRNLY